MNFLQKILFIAALVCVGTSINVLAEDAKPEPKSADATNNVTADDAWKELEMAMRRPPIPAEWREKRPTPAEIAKYRENQRVLAGIAATKAREFYTRYPDYPKVKEARDKEREMLEVAIQLGDTERTARLEELEKERLKDPNLSDDEKFELRMEAVQRAARAKQSEGMEATMAELEKGARSLLKDFPKRQEVYGLLMEVASSATGEKARAIAEEIVNSSAPDEIKDMAKGIVKRMDALGKPLPIQFTSVDGRKVDLSTMAGKVVLIDFWATWCGPCVAELPNVKAAYDELHPKGFEIVGISFDQDKEQLVQFVSEKKMAWPQYFDGEGWKNKIGREYGINSIPSMWLVDKKGILRDLNARDGLAKKVQEYLDQD